MADGLPQPLPLEELIGHYLAVGIAANLMNLSVLQIGLVRTKLLPAAM
jgi:hypothetical protein